MLRLRDRLYAGMVGNEITGALADQIWTRMQAFANYGFPESHAISFALIVYASAWCKRHLPRRPAARVADGLLLPPVAGRRRPPARRPRAPPDLHASLAAATLEPHPDSTGRQAVRLGLAEVRDLGDDLIQAIVDERDRRGPYDSQADLARRVRLTTPQMEALATAGAFDSLGLTRRQALWSAGAAARERPDTLPDTTPTSPPPQPCPAWTTSSYSPPTSGPPASPPTTTPSSASARPWTGSERCPRPLWAALPDGDRVVVGGISFLNLEDESA